MLDNENQEALFNQHGVSQEWLMLTSVEGDTQAACLRVDCISAPTWTPNLLYHSSYFDCTCISLTLVGDETLLLQDGERPQLGELTLNLPSEYLSLPADFDYVAIRLRMIHAWFALHGLDGVFDALVVQS